MVKVTSGLVARQKERVGGACPSQRWEWGGLATNPGHGARSHLKKQETGREFPPPTPPIPTGPVGVCLARGATLSTRDPRGEGSKPKPMWQGLSEGFVA